MKLSVAISPCPNDTYMFGPLALGLLKNIGLELQFHYYDIEELNNRALKEIHDVTKMSFAAWLRVKESYTLLQAGAALGYNCGPLLVSHNTTSVKKGGTVAIPGEMTTANLLYSLWQQDGTVQRVYCRYDEVMPLLESGECDYGVIIHEGRFTARARGHTIVCDLGQWWEKLTGLPIPLGCIAVKKNLSDFIRKQIEKGITQSISYASAHTDLIMAYIKKHAQEIEESVIEQHISTFVNNQSLELDATAQQAIAMLEKLAVQRGLI